MVNVVMRNCIATKLTSAGKWLNASKSEPWLAISVLRCDSVFVFFLIQTVNILTRFSITLFNEMSLSRVVYATELH